MSTVLDFFEDSKILCERAQRHFDEFNQLIARDSRPSLWEIKEFADEGGETFTYVLLVNRGVLSQVKPVAADVANNLVHALDQLVGAAARLRGHGRQRNLYFPWLLDEASFERRLRELEVFIGSGAVAAIRDVRQRHNASLPHVHAIKEVSNSGKHWELIPSSASAAAVAVDLPGQPQRIWEVPPDAFYQSEVYEFAVGVPRMRDVAFMVVIKFEFEGLGEGVPASPDNIFSWAFRYVRDMIEAVSEVRNWRDPEPAG